MGKRWTRAFLAPALGCAAVATTLMVNGSAGASGEAVPQCWADALADIPPSEVYAGAPTEEAAVRHGRAGAESIGRDAAAGGDRESISGSPEVAEARIDLYRNAVRDGARSDGTVAWEHRRDGEIRGAIDLAERDGRWYVVADHVRLSSNSC